MNIVGKFFKIQAIDTTDKEYYKEIIEQTDLSNVAGCAVNLGNILYIKNEDKLVPVKRNSIHKSPFTIGYVAMVELQKQDLTTTID